MNTIDETEVKTTEALPEAEEKPVRKNRWIENVDEEDAAALAEALDLDESELSENQKRNRKKKKKRFLQVPVIISLCLVLIALLGYFSYTLLWTTEPEGTVWNWSSDKDNVQWYYEFKDNNVFKAYVGSFEVTANYAKDKSEEGAKSITTSINVQYQNLGCVFFGYAMNYDITGLRLLGNQEMKITYADDPSNQEFVLKQSSKPDTGLELPEDFKEDKELTGEWVNTYSSSSGEQTIVFKNNGQMILTETYDFSDGSFTEIRRNCTYTAEDKEIDISWRAEEVVVHHSEYSIKNGILTLDGATYYRKGNSPATPDETE